MRLLLPCLNCAAAIAFFINSVSARLSVKRSLEVFSPKSAALQLQLNEHLKTAVKAGEAVVLKTFLSYIRKHFNIKLLVFLRPDGELNRDHLQVHIDRLRNKKLWGGFKKEEHLTTEKLTGKFCRRKHVLVVGSEARVLREVFENSNHHCLVALSDERFLKFKLRKSLSASTLYDLSLSD